MKIRQKWKLLPLLMLIIFISIAAGMLFLININNKDHPVPYGKDIYKNHTVEIIIDDGEVTTRGAGFWFAKDDSYLYVCANAHTLKADTIGSIRFYNGEQYAYDKFYVDEATDVSLAGISLDILSDEIIKASDTSLQFKTESTVITGAENVHMIIPNGDEINGDFIGITTIDEWPYPILETTIDIEPGSSGSPIYDRDGYIVGMAMGKWSMPFEDERFFAVSSADIVKSIKSFSQLL